jgi:flagellar FliL protein
MSQDTQTQAAPAPKKSRKGLFLGLALVLIAGGGGGAYWMFGPSAEAVAGKAAEEPAVPAAIVTLDPFVVNLADPGGTRFLRVSMGLVVAGEDQAKEFDEDAVAKMRLRSSILEMLAQQTAARLVSAEGKAELKKAVAQHATHSAEHLKVSDVLFSEFIVQ